MDSAVMTKRRGFGNGHRTPQPQEQPTHGSITPLFLHILQKLQTRPLHPPLLCSTASESRCSLFHGARSPAGPQIGNAAHSPANYMQIFNGYF